MPELWGKASRAPQHKHAGTMRTRVKSWPGHQRLWAFFIDHLASERAGERSGRWPDEVFSTVSHTGGNWRVHYSSIPFEPALVHAYVSFVRKRDIFILYLVHCENRAILVYRHLPGTSDFMGERTKQKVGKLINERGMRLFARSRLSKG